MSRVNPRCAPPQPIAATRPDVLQPIRVLRWLAGASPGFISRVKRHYQSRSPGSAGEGARAEPATSKPPHFRRRRDVEAGIGVRDKSGELAPARLKAVTEAAE